MSSRASSTEVLAIFAKTYKKYRGFQGVPLLERLVLILLGRDLAPTKADPVLEKIKKEFVNWNEARLARVEDLRRIIAQSGAPDAAHRAMLLRELLSKVFVRRHALEADFLRDEDKDARAEFLSGLPGLDYAQCQAFEASLQDEKGEIPVTPHAQRVAQRLGWLPKGSPPLMKSRKVLTDAAHGDPVNLIYGLVKVGEDYCHSRTPDCPRCPLQAVCPTGKKWKEPAGKAGAAE